MNRKRLEIEISSDLDYEEMIVNIISDGENIATLSQEEGFENLKIEIFPPLESKSWVFFFDDFDKALQSAKKQLQTMHKLPDE